MYVYKLGKILKTRPLPLGRQEVDPPLSSTDPVRNGWIPSWRHGAREGRRKKMGLLRTLPSNVLVICTGDLLEEATRRRRRRTQPPRRSVEPRSERGPARGSRVGVAAAVAATCGGHRGGAVRGKQRRREPARRHVDRGRER